MATVSLKYRRIDDPPNAALVQVSGSLDAATIVTFEGSLLRLRTEGINKFILDLGDLSYMSSTGVGALVKLADGLRAQSGGVVLCRLQETVRLSFNLLGLGSVLPVFESVADAGQAMSEQFEVGPDGESMDPSAASSILRGYEKNPTDVSVIDGIFARVAMKLELCDATAVGRALATVGDRAEDGSRTNLRDAMVQTGAITAAQAEEVHAVQARVQLVCPRCNREADMRGSWSEGSLCERCQVPLRIDLPTEPYDPRAVADAIVSADTIPLDTREFRDEPLGGADAATPDDSWVGRMLQDAPATPAATERRGPSGIGPAPVPAPPASGGGSWLDERTAVIVIVVALVAGLVGWILRAIGS